MSTNIGVITAPQRPHTPRRPLIPNLKITKLTLKEDATGHILTLPHTTLQTNNATHLTIHALNPGTITNWTLHKNHTTHLLCPKATIELALHDNNHNNKTYQQTHTLYIGERTPQLIEIPPNTYYAAKNTTNTTAIITKTTPQNDTHTLPPHTDKINYNWRNPSTVRLI